MRGGAIGGQEAGPEPGIMKGRGVGGVMAGQHCRGEVLRPSWSAGVNAEGDGMVGQNFR